MPRLYIDFLFIRFLSQCSYYTMFHKKKNFTFLYNFFLLFEKIYMLQLLKTNVVNNNNFKGRSMITSSIVLAFFIFLLHF